jgi:putative iron-regulated protein
MPEENLPGTRQYTDYSTHEHADRRRQYLKVVTKLLVSDLKRLSDSWSNSGAYRIVFEALPPKVALQQLINGAFFMAGDELSSERMIAPVDSTDGIAGSGQEDEHSCFSDNTHNDIYANALGISHVIFGKYKTISGVSFYDLVKQINPEEARRLKDATEDVMQKVTHIAANEQPFDYLITKESSSDSDFGPIMTAVVSLQNLSDQISIAASEIGLNLR